MWFIYMKIAVNTVIDALNRKFPNKTWTKETINKKFDEFSSKDEAGRYSEYCQYIVSYLSKRIRIVPN